MRAQLLADDELNVHFLQLDADPRLGYGPRRAASSVAAPPVLCTHIQGTLLADASGRRPRSPLVTGP